MVYMVHKWSLYHYQHLIIYKPYNLYIYYTILPIDFLIYGL